MYFFLIALAIALCFGLLIYVIFSKKSNTSTVYMSKLATVDPKLRGAVNMVGGDIMALLPDSLKKKKVANPKLRALFVQSGNPWNLKPMEFFLIQIVLGMLGFGAGVILVCIVQFNLIINFLIIFICTIVAYNYPHLVYQNAANKRESDFKRFLPEGVDYLVMALSGGSSSLPAAFERVVKYMPDNVVRAEFQNVVDALNSGKSMTRALDELAERVPTEGIQAFVKSLNNAHQQSVPLANILRQRAEASRADLRAEMERKITVMPTKIMLIVGPVAYICILVVALAPTVELLMQII